MKVKEVQVQSKKPTGELYGKQNVLFPKKTAFENKILQLCKRLGVTVFFLPIMKKITNDHSQYLYFIADNIMIFFFQIHPEKAKERIGNYFT